MTTSIDEFKYKRDIAKLEADIAKFSTWLKEHPAAPAEHREVTRVCMRKAISLRKQIVALREERRMSEVMHIRSGGKPHARLIDLTDRAMAERAVNPDAPLPSTRVDALRQQALAEHLMGEEPSAM